MRTRAPKFYIVGNLFKRAADEQTAQVLKLMQRDGNVTRLTASHYGIANLTARIADLRVRFGINVQCEKRRDAAGRLYGVWKLPQDTDRYVVPA